MQDYAFQQRKLTTSKKSSGGRNTLIFLIIVVFFLWVLFKGLNGIFSLGSVIKEIHLVTGDEKKQASPLQIIVEKDLAGATGQYGVYIKNLRTNETYGLHDHIVFDSASLYKLWVMGSVFDQIEKGNISEDQMLKEDVQVLNDKFQIASESAELTDGTVEQTVSDSLEKMITISDNYSALLLAWKLRLSTIAAYLVSHGFTESRVGVNGGNPTTTSSDIGLFFEKLYHGKLGNKSSTEAMLGLLNRQALNEKLPKLLPDRTMIAHKTGELDTLSHDGGIVYTPKGDYVLVILSDTNNPPNAETRISEISRDVYAYFTK